MSTDNKLADAVAYITRKIADHEQLMATVERLAKAGRWEGVASYREATENLPALRNVLEALADHDSTSAAPDAPAPVQPSSVSTPIPNTGTYFAQPPAPGEVELPPLPDRFDSVSVDDFTGHRLSVYTASQMEAYARAAIAARTCPLPAHWRMAIEEWEGRMLPSPRKLKEICDLIEQRARQMAKVGGDRG